jgi:hypothetical protein
MKNIFKKMAYSLAAGIVFGIGVFIFFAVVNSFPTEQTNIKNIVSLPETVKVISHNRVPDTYYFTIQGILRNDSDQEYWEIDVNAEILANETKVNSCKNVITGVKPKSNYAFLIVCSDVKGKEIPSNITYRISKLVGFQVGKVAHNQAFQLSAYRGASLAEGTN